MHLNLQLFRIILENIFNFFNQSKPTILFITTNLVQIRSRVPSPNRTFFILTDFVISWEPRDSFSKLQNFRMSENENPIFHFLPSVGKICQLVDKSLNIYNYPLGGAVEADRGIRESPPLYDNRTNLVSEVDQSASLLNPGTARRASYHFKT